MGIDLGTTYSCIGHMGSTSREQQWSPMMAEPDQACMPSVVCFHAKKGILVGKEAEDSDCEPQYLIRESKRLMGLPRNASAVAYQKEHVLYEIDNVSDHQDVDSALIVGKGQEGYMWSARKEHFLPEEIAAIILIKLKSVCERSLGTNCRSAVVTVPAQFSDGQRKATRDAMNLV